MYARSEAVQFVSLFHLLPSFLLSVCQFGLEIVCFAAFCLRRFRSHSCSRRLRFLSRHRSILDFPSSRLQWNMRGSPAARRRVWLTVDNSFELSSLLHFLIRSLGFFQALRSASGSFCNVNPKFEVDSYCLASSYIECKRWDGDCAVPKQA